MDLDNEKHQDSVDSGKLNYMLRVILNSLLIMNFRRSALEEVAQLESIGQAIGQCRQLKNIFTFLCGRKVFIAYCSFSITVYCHF